MKPTTEFKYITIFGIGAGKDGQHTTRFNNVTNFISGEESITFYYTSASTGEKHQATFLLDNISGVSYPVEE